MKKLVLSFTLLMSSVLLHTHEGDFHHHHGHHHDKKNVIIKVGGENREYKNSDRIISTTSMIVSMAASGIAGYAATQRNGARPAIGVGAVALASFITSNFYQDPQSTVSYGWLFIGNIFFALLGALFGIAK